QRATRRIQLRHKCIVGAGRRPLQGAGRGEIGGGGSAGDVGVAGGVHGNAVGGVEATAAQVGGVNQATARRTQLRDKGIVTAPLKPMEGMGGGEIGGKGIAGDVGVPGAVHRDTLAEVVVGAAQVRGIDPGASRGVQLGYKGVVGAAAKGTLGGAGRREVD